MAHSGEVQPSLGEFVHNEKRALTQQSDTQLVPYYSTLPAGLTKLSDRNLSMSFIDNPEHERNSAISHSPFEQNG